MSDIIDSATKNSADALARQIESQRNRIEEPPQVVNGKHYCIDCDNPINPERVAIAPDAPRCVFCQTDFEEQEKHFA